MLLVTLGARLLSNILAVKGIIRTREGFLRAGYGSSIKKTRIFNTASSFN